MRYFPYQSEKKPLPRPADADQCRTGLQRWRQAVAEIAPGAWPDDGDGDAPEALLAAVFGNSPYLGESLLREPEFALALLRDGPDAAVKSALAGLVDWPAATADGRALATALRVAKRRMALTVAIADIAGLWPLQRVTAELSAFADRAVALATGFALAEAAGAGAFSLPEPGRPEAGSGFVVLALGKLGASELNYSSDIDLVILYDPDRVATDDGERLQNQFARVTRRIIGLIDERTIDGYVFRMDLRLRPDPGSTPIAMSVLAAEQYYESIGQNWERAAMIKARQIAGDRDAGAAFLSRLTPFIWRKNLDFAAINDIQSIKRQIAAHGGGDQICVAGHDIKLGRGGIREIEFFAQTQQLIWGGRAPQLRAPATLAAIDALVAFGQVAPAVRDDLGRAYRYLRRLEHRLQMINDEQTQTIPDSEDGLRRLALFMGHADAGDFGATLTRLLATVDGHYGRLFAASPALTAKGDVQGNLVFTGSDPDPDTYRTILGLGFKNPKAVDFCVRGWHHGRTRATHSTRARELLTELMPVLLSALARTPDPDGAFTRFADFLAGLPAGVQLFSMFHSHPELLDLVAEIMGAAPRLADHLTRRPSVLDAVLAPGFFEPLADAETLAADLHRALEAARVFEDVLDLVRRWAADHKFQAGVQMLHGADSIEHATRGLSDIAEVVLGALQRAVERDFALRHGRVEGGELVIVGFGKLGGREITPASDLDLVFVYAAPDGAQSDGEKPLGSGVYYRRLAQRIIGAVSSLTAEGWLYDVDTRLRPDGLSGPVATAFEGFQRYYVEAAWTWELMALTRARVVSGPPGLAARVEACISEVLHRRRDPGTLLTDVAQMRARLDREFHTEVIWNLKHVRGGLLDVEFMVQYLALKHAADHPEIVSPNTRRSLENIQRAGLLDTDTAADLRAALMVWQRLQVIVRLTLAEDMAERSGEQFPESLQRILARVGEAENFERLVRKITAMAARVSAHFARLIDAPAAAKAEKDG